MVVTVEHMQKVSQDDARHLTASMNAEWKSVLTAANAEVHPLSLSPKEEPYWTEEKATMLRRLQSEAVSPPRVRRTLDYGN